MKDDKAVPSGLNKKGLCNVLDGIEVDAPEQS